MCLGGNITLYADGSYSREYDYRSRYPEGIGNMPDETIIETTATEVTKADTDKPPPPPPTELVSAQDKLTIAAAIALAQKVIHLTADHHPGKAYKGLLADGVPDPTVVREAIRQAIQPPWREVFNPDSLSDDMAVIALLIMGGVWNDGFQSAIHKLEEASKEQNR